VRMAQEQKIYKVEVSAKTIVFAVFFLLLLALLWVVRNLMLSLFIAFIIMSAVKPPVLFLEQRKVPRRLGVLGIFILLILFFSFLLVWVIPPIVSETVLLLRHLPSMIGAVNPAIIEYVNLDSLSQYVPNITTQAIQIIQTLFSNVMFVMTTLFFSIYLTIEDGFVEKTLLQFFSEKEARSVSVILKKTEKRLGSWLLGELFLMLIVGFLTYIGLTLIGVRYALPLSIIAGLLEVVPNIGPTVSTIPAFIVAIAQSYFLGFASIALYFIIQQLENNLIVPYVMKKAIGLNPIVTLISLIVGGQLFGILGIILSIPLTLFLETLLVEVLNTKQQTA